MTYDVTVINPSRESLTLKRHALSLKLMKNT